MTSEPSHRYQSTFFLRHLLDRLFVGQEKIKPAKNAPVRIKIKQYSFKSLESPPPQKKLPNCYYYYIFI